MSQLHRSGPTLGTFLGRPIFKELEDTTGKYIFDRIGRCDEDGCSLHQLRDNEILVGPALIYRRVA